MSLARPKGMPRKEWDAKSEKRKARFLNFNIQTSQTVHGGQNYGMGNTIKSKSRSRGSTQVAPYMGDSFGGRTMKSSLREIEDGSGGVVMPIHHKLDKITLSGSELIMDVSGDTSFASTSVSVQPGLVGTFPWLSKIAALYQKYRFKKLCFEYRPLVGVFASEATTGRVGLALDSDSTAQDLVNVEQANLLDPNVSGLLTQTVCLPADSSSAGKRYVRTGAVPPGSDIKSYDFAKLFVFAYATQTTGVIGELHVHYEIELIGPLLAVAGAPIANHHVVTRQNALTATALGVPVACPLDIPVLSGFPVTVVAGVVTMQPGLYRFVHHSEVVVTGGTIQQFELGVVQLPTLWTGPQFLTSHGAGDALIASGIIDWTVRVDQVSTFQFERRITASAGTAEIIDWLSIEVIEA